MPLHILGLLVIGGIGGIAVLLHLLGLTGRKRFADEAAARAAWLDELPDATPTRVILCHNHSAALIETAQGPGIVWPMGADSTARFLTGARITARKGGVTVRLPDYTAPRVHLQLDADEAAQWISRLEPAT